MAEAQVGPEGPEEAGLGGGSQEGGSVVRALGCHQRSRGPGEGASRCPWGRGRGPSWGVKADGSC